MLYASILTQCFSFYKSFLSIFDIFFSLSKTKGLRQGFSCFALLVSSGISSKIDDYWYRLWNFKAIIPKPHPFFTLVGSENGTNIKLIHSSEQKRAASSMRQPYHQSINNHIKSFSLHFHHRSLSNHLSWKPVSSYSLRKGLSSYLLWMCFRFHEQGHHSRA